MSKNFLFLFSFLFTVNCSFGQITKDVLRDSVLSVTLDSVLVISAKKGLSAEDFILQMQTDTLFYQAFRNMSKFSFIAENNIKTFDEDQKTISKIFRKIFHNNSSSNYKQEIIEQRDSGKVFKRNGDFDLYTVKMFAYIFMNPNSSDFIKAELKRKEKGEESYKDRLKTLIFNPGKSVDGIPLISEKTRIFDPKYRKYYDYSFYHATYQDSIPVYRFRCTLKKDLSKSMREDMVIKDITTIFDVYNLNILARDIHLSYFSIPFDFDVKMSIELMEKNGMYVPKKIKYSGFWDVPFKEIENCIFNVKHYNYMLSK